MWSPLLLLSVVVAVVVAAPYQQEEYLPVVLWHGMGDFCVNPFSMGRIKRTIREEHPGTYVLCLQIGDNMVEDIKNGYLSNMNEVIEDVCATIAADEKLQNGYNAIGFSQGAQFLRAVVQRCGGPKVHSLISIGGQHQGVFGIPGCPSVRPECDVIRRAATAVAYTPEVQKRSVQTQYWHDSTKKDDYRELNLFLADINQENYVNETYKEGIKNLEAFVMLKFNMDSMVEPMDSQWFGFYHDGQGNTTYTLQESNIYLEDRLGLKELDEAGKIHFLEIDGDHLDMPTEYFVENIVKVFL